MKRLLLLLFSLFTFHVSFAGGVCLCGEAPERANDFFWENDRVGFRAYGPGDVHKWSGIDVFNKNCATNLVVHWLREPGRHGNWHLNRNGLGMDDYAVGPGRGVGGVALRKDGQWLPDYGNWVRSRILTNGDERCAFELDYKLSMGGVMTLSISLEKGASLFREAVSFSRDTPLEGVEVGVGLDLNASRLHAGDVQIDERLGLVSLFEKPHVDKDGRPVPGEEGSTMSAVRAIAGYAALADEPNGAKMLMTKPLGAADANGRPVLEVFAGAEWSEAGHHVEPAAWHAYVRGFGNVYLDLMERAVSAYSDEHLKAYLADVEREGVQEHGFPRLAANFGILVANGRLSGKRDLLVRMMNACCRDAEKEMPPKSGGNEFSVKELVEAVVALERAKAFPKETTDGWRKAISAIVAEKSYTTGRIPVGEQIARNWVVFAAASEQARIAHGMGGDPKFVEKYVADQLRWFDENGMYKDPNQPAVYDLVTRLQFALILHYGYSGPSRAKLEALMERSAEPTLKMLSACGEIPYGGRSNQFLHNNTFYAALCEWYAACCRTCAVGGRCGEGKQQAYDNKEMERRFAGAARAAVEALRPWLGEKPLSHVKNRYPRELGKGVFSEQGDMGCERYAYFDKYMVTMGSWAMNGWLFAGKEQQAYDRNAALRQQAYDGKFVAYDSKACCRTLAVVQPSVFATSPDFHFVFLSAGDYSAQFDYDADAHYDCDGLGRVHRAGAPAAICLSTPCAEHPNYRIETPNDAPLAIAPVEAAISSKSPCRFVRAYTNAVGAVCEWRSGNATWQSVLSPKGLETTLSGEGPLALALPAFAFDGRESTRLEAGCRTLAVFYRGWKCLFQTDGQIVDTGRTACNRNGRYRRFEARGEKSLTVRISIERE